MNATVAMPWRATTDRIPAYQRCTQYWLDHGYPIVFGDSDPLKAFNRSQARNNAVRQASTGVVIIADADVLPADINLVEQAVDLAADGCAVSPYSTYRLLPASAVTADDLPSVEPVREYPRKYRPCGITVITREAFDAVGGYNERFGSGWGYEDAAFALACETLIGLQQLDGALYAFDHLSHRRRDPRNRRRFWWYRLAAGNPDEMRRLIAGHTKDNQ